MDPVKRARKVAGFTLVELMMVVAIIGILAAVAIPAFTRYVRKSRSAEAMGILNRMWAGSLSYYETDHQDANSQTLAKQFPGPLGVESTPGGLHCGCQPTGAKCPGSDPSWNTDPVWQGLNLVMQDAHSYVSNYSGSGSNTSATFTAGAFGDLDCDSTIATFVRVGGIDLATGDVRGGIQPYVDNELE